MLSRNVKLVVNKKIQNQITTGNFNFKHANAFAIFFKRTLASAVNVKQNFNLSQEEIQPFFTITSEVVKYLNEIKLFTEFSNLKNRMTNIIEYPSKISNLESPLTTLVAYKILEKPENLTEENIRLAYLLGWFTEMVQCAMFMQKDAIDNIGTRNNFKTWHTDNDYSFQTPNDAVILESAIFILLKKYFAKHKNYVKIFDCFHETFYKSLQGNNLELINKDIEKFNMELVNKISNFKIAPSLCILPVMSAFYLSNNQELGNLEVVKTILRDISLFKKIKADYLDSFDKSPKHLNTKLGFCSWLVVKALEKASNDQKSILKQHYGNPDASSVSKINALYQEMNLSTEFDSFKKQHYIDTKNKIDKLDGEAVKKMLANILSNTL